MQRRRSVVIYLILARSDEVRAVFLLLAGPARRGPGGGAGIGALGGVRPAATLIGSGTRIGAAPLIGAAELLGARIGARIRGARALGVEHRVGALDLGRALAGARIADVHTLAACRALLAEPALVAERAL